MNLIFLNIHRSLRTPARNGARGVVGNDLIRLGKSDWFHARIKHYFTIHNQQRDIVVELDCIEIGMDDFVFDLVNCATTLLRCSSDFYFDVCLVVVNTMSCGGRRVNYLDEISP
jgi:hypothetical protein